jgi:hypothetical protein
MGTALCSLHVGDEELGTDIAAYRHETCVPVWMDSAESMGLSCSAQKCME